MQQSQHFIQDWSTERQKFKTKVKEQTQGFFKGRLKQKSLPTKKKCQKKIDVTRFCDSKQSTEKRNQNLDR